MSVRHAAGAALSALAALVAGDAGQARDAAIPRVTVFGDSAATAMAYDPDAKRILGRGIELQLEVAACRRVGDASCPYDGIRPPNVIERATELGRQLGQVVVVVVGYNDYESRYAENIEAALDVFRKAGVERVLWATLRASRQSYASMNEAILAVARRAPQLTVLDWNAQAKDHENWLQPDGIHLTPSGAQGMASMINDALVSLGVASRPRATARRLSIATRALPVGRVGRPFTARLQALGGSGQYRWSRVRGGIAPGLRLTSAGVLTGKPTRAGRFRFAVKVVDRAGTARAHTLVLTVRR